MKKSSAIIIGIIVVIVLAGGGYLLFHKSNKGTSTTANSSAPAVNNAVLTTKTDSSLGQYLADASGKALYTYNSDSKGASNCTGVCLSDWPIYKATGSTANLPAGVSTIKRTDGGQIQYTYNGMPLYYFSGDSNGQVTGDGVESFTVAKPAAASSSSTSSSSSSSAPTTTTQPSDSSSSSTYPY